MIERAFRVDGMHCGACVGLIEDEVGEVAGVEAVTVDLDAGTAHIRYDPDTVDEARLIEAIREAGYSATPR
jgi:copper ion binding protein